MRKHYKPVRSHFFIFLCCCFIYAACTDAKKQEPVTPARDTIAKKPVTPDAVPGKKADPVPGNSKLLPVHPDSVVQFARTLTGVPYRYASADPATGFDCSGFITYVFNHFGMTVPRSSVDFTDYGREISREQARPGDLILFTGTDSSVRVVGHMGIVENTADGRLRFIHSTSGKGYGVVISPFEKYYQGRFVKLIRVFPDEQFQ